MKRNILIGAILIVILAGLAGYFMLEKDTQKAAERAYLSARDSDRLSDILNIQRALEFFADKHNKEYPQDIYSQAPCKSGTNCGLGSPDACGNVPCVGTVDIDSTGRRYTYTYHLTGSRVDAYHLGTSLENSTAPSLTTDRDCNSKTGIACPFVSGWNQQASFDGSDDRGCSGEEGLHCYDVTN